MAVQFLFENDGYKGFYEKQTKYVPNCSDTKSTLKLTSS